MRWFARTFLVLAIAWSLYWAVASFGIRRSLTAWFDAQTARGWQADFGEIESSGYPFRHLTRLLAPALADPVSGTAWRADWLEFESPAIWPGRQTLWFADTAQRLSYFDQTATVTAAGMKADLFLHPGVDLALGHMSLTSGPWEIAMDDKTGLAADSLGASMVQSETPQTYHVNFEARNFAPSEGIRRILTSATTQPDAFETLQLDMDVTFDRVWDRRALEERRPQPRRIDLGLMQATWGAMRISMAGKVDIDTAGMPAGTVSIKADGWREMLALAQETGALPEQAVGPVTRTLETLSRLSGNRNALDATLKLRNGMVTFGPVPLGPAPHIFLR